MGLRRHNQVSAGILLYRNRSTLEVLIAHPGGPFWRNRDDGWWSIPKGLVKPGEQPLDAARREFEEETGMAPPAEGYMDLGSVVQKGGKRVHAWAVAGDGDPEQMVSNTFPLEWPPGSGRVQDFPEIDRFMWATREIAARKLNKAQMTFVWKLSADKDV